MVHEKVGAPQKVREYIDLAKIARNPEEGLAAYQRKYSAGNNSPQFIQAYLNRLASAYLPTAPVMKKYLATQSESDLLNRYNWNILYGFVTEIDDPLFLFLVKHKAEFSKSYTRDSVNKKIGDVYMYALRASQRKSDYRQADSAYAAMKARVKATGFEGAGKVIFECDLQWLQERGKNKEFLELAYGNMDKYYADDPGMLNNVAGIFSSVTTEPKYLEKAISWSRKALSLKEEPSYADTYASLLFKTGKKDEAIEEEKRAIAVAKSKNLPSTTYEEALKRFEGPK